MNYEKLVRRMRRKIWDYDDTPKEAQAQRVLHKAIRLMVRHERAQETEAQRRARENREILRRNSWLTAMDLIG